MIRAKNLLITEKKLSNNASSLADFTFQTTMYRTKQKIISNKKTLSLSLG